MNTLVLRLYISGETPHTQRALANLRQICETHGGDRFEVEVIDVLERPDLAEREKILATPTLVRVLPLPSRRVIGDLSSKEKVLEALEFIEVAATERR